MPPTEVLAYRVIWSLLTVMIMLTWTGRWGEVLVLLASGRRLAVLAASTACISVNWLVFIRVVGEGNVLEASMGYFLNPLVNVALGVVVLGERLRPLQWVAVGLALAGIVELAIGTGTAPWAALTLAGTFGVYGLLRKKLPVAPLTGLAVETGLMLPLAVAYLSWRVAEGAPLLGGSPELGAALLASGPVTALPLLWFAAAASRLRYATLGFFQYLAPTGHFLLAVLVYGESPGPAHLITFGCIWAAIGLYLADSWRHSRR
ncbi:Predicted permease [Paramagnetospirillum magneticum AMB-1]|uniref:Predicted permease n=1 Tax=Paramagnetospirillum magneticum (strain ATCC 700264 / AMB-1) TaxID=342108 RepID=Q2W7W8_PARM1|nr:Predicted permease [Paramagnetospirillum magneticum AMB-1]